MRLEGRYSDRRGSDHWIYTTYAGIYTFERRTAFHGVRGMPDWATSQMKERG